MHTIKAGRPIIDLLKLCYKANCPPLLSGPHGVGKSELLEQAAKALGIEFISCDLSLMEPPDLIGLPKVYGKVTRYVPPAFLPRSGKGLLLFEELNRCERYMRAPCLQLLTARKLNDYSLPKDWLPAAAINPPDEDYEVFDIDPALESRFVQAAIVADQQEWLAWACNSNVHSAVIEYVEGDPSVFNKPESNPRAWKYVSDILFAAEKEKANSGAMSAAVVGLVGDRRGAAFLKTLKCTERSLRADEVLAAYSRHRAEVRRWIKARRLDLVKSALLAIQKHLQPKTDYESVKRSRKQWQNLSVFLHDLPGDLLEEAREFFKEREYAFPRRPKN